VDIKMLEECFNIRHRRGGFYQVIQGRTHGLQGSFDVLAPLTGLDPPILFANKVPLMITGELAGDKDPSLPLSHDDMGIAHMTGHNTLCQGFRLDILSLHHCPPVNLGRTSEGALAK
jgi:hypothetical protein